MQRGESAGRGSTPSATCRMTLDSPFAFNENASNPHSITASDMIAEQHHLRSRCGRLHRRGAFLLALLLSLVLLPPAAPGSI